MKKIILTLFSLLILTSVSFATLYKVTLIGVTIANPFINNTWYVSALGSGLKNGKDQADSFAIGSINSTSIKAGDTVYLCGTIASKITISKSGASGYPLIYRGDCPSNTAVIDGANVLNSSWTSVSSNVYSTPLSIGSGPYGNTPSGIVTEDDSPLIAVGWNTNATTTITAMVAYGNGTWSYDPINGILYVLTSSADDPTGHTIEASYGQNFSNQITETNQKYLTFENMTIKNTGDIAFQFNGGSNITVTDNTIYNTGNWAILATPVINCIVNGNTFYNDTWMGHLPLSVGIGEVVRFDSSSSGGSIYNNTITTSPSIGINLHGGTTGVSVYGNTVHDNIGLTSQFASGIYLDNAQNNFVYDNLIYNQVVGITLSSETSPFASSGNLVYNNLIYNWYRSAMYLGTGGLYVSSENNQIYNNTFVTGPGAFTFAETIYIQNSENDIFKNNILFGADVGWVPSSFQIFGANDFDYNQYLGTTFSNNGVSQTYAQWKSANGGDSHSGNSNPSIGSVFVGSSIPPPSNFELVVASSPIGAGVNLYSIFTTDYDGGSRQSSGAWDVGAYAYP